MSEKKKIDPKNPSTPAVVEAETTPTEDSRKTQRLNQRSRIAQRSIQQ